MPPKPYMAPPFYPSVKSADPQVEALAIPGYYQVREYTCGFACTLMALHYYRRYVSPQDLYERLGTNCTGTRQGAIVRELRAAGCGAAIVRDFDFARLRNSIGRNRLVIGYHHRLEHWVVLYGYGTNPERVLVADPLLHHRAEHAWSHYGPKLCGFGIAVTSRARHHRATIEKLSTPDSILEPCRPDALH